MNPLDFLNQNPALLSIIAFPLGVLILFAVGKLLKLDTLFSAFIKALNDHTAAELKIEERLMNVVNELKNVAAAQWDNRRYVDEIRDYFTERFNRVEAILDDRFDRLEHLIPKRKED